MICSATEGLESLPYLAKSVEAFIDGKPYHVGPSAIGLRMNPYGEAPMANPGNIRQAMNGMDPRQRGLFAAAWSVGFVARFAKGGASALTLGGTVGEFGIAYAKTAYPQPWFDENGGLYPVYHVIKGLAALRGRPLIDLAISKPREIQAIAVERDRGDRGLAREFNGSNPDAGVKAEFCRQPLRPISIGVRTSDPGFFGHGLVGTCILRRR